MLIKKVDTLISAIREKVDDDPKNKNKIIETLKEFYEPVNALIKTEQLLNGEIEKVLEPYVYQIVKVLEIENIGQYFYDDNKFNEVFERVVKLENKVDSQEKRIENLETKINKRRSE